MSGDIWQAQAACLGEDWTLFFPGDGDPGRRVREAKAICAGCPVREPCLEEALKLGSESDFGIWGGTTDRERRSIRLRRHTVVDQEVAAV